MIAPTDVLDMNGTKIGLLIVSLLMRPPVPVPGKTDVCTCAAAKRDNEWCKHCNVGYVASVKIPSKLLFEEIDAHGHDIQPESFKCKSCQAALRSDGYCLKCRIGFVRKQAYLSLLTYQLAKGKKKNPDTFACAACKKHATGYGWCDTCKRGMVGNVAITDAADYAKATKAYDLLILAVRTLARCELCAVAIILDGWCGDCKVSYRDGKRVPEKRRHRP